MRMTFASKLIESLKGKTEAKNNVAFMMRSASPGPSISVFFIDETSKDYTYSPLTTERTLTFTVESFLEGESTKAFSKLIQQIEKQVNIFRQEVSSDYTIKNMGLQFPLPEKEPSKASIFLQLVYSVTYFKNEEEDYETTNINDFIIEGEL